MSPEIVYLFYALCAFSGIFLGIRHRKGDYLVPIVWGVILLITQSPYLLIALVCYGVGMGVQLLSNRKQDKDN